MSDQGYRRPVRLWGFVIFRRVPLLAVLVAASAAVGAGAADPPKGGVRVPAGPAIPAPMPNPAAPIKLTPDLVFAVDADYECVVISSPANALRITADKGPLKVRGKFVDGTGQVETRTFSGTHVYFVEAQAAGECELLILPVGGKEADLIRRRILCVVGPQPPPDPEPKPPDPKPPEPKPVTGFRVVFVYESGDALTPAQQRVMYSPKVRDFLDAKTTPSPDGKQKGWRRYDKDVDATNEPDPTIKALWQAVKPKLTTVPCVVIAVNDKAEVLPLPADEDAAIALFTKYLEGK